MVLMDPLDVQANIDVNLSAGYIICGTSTILVYVTGGDVLKEVKK